ncbi:uncharacterized protein [Montipora capricornis]|uniref:uncharacterized protein n=1 Tax=Montipora capricornis TaxID=246305 RepID=UPI0035F1D650
MKAMILSALLVSAFVLTIAKPVKEEDDGFLVKREDKRGADEELETSGDGKEDEEDGSSIDEEPRAREKRGKLEELEEDKQAKDSSGDDSEEEDEEAEEEGRNGIKELNKDSSGDDDLSENELQWKNTLGIRGPLSITAFQPGSSATSSKKGKKQKDQASMDFVTPSGNLEITPFAPAINRLKKVRRRCMCPLPCDYEVIGCSGPYTIPCGGFGGLWPALGCGGYGSCGGCGGLYGGLGGYGLGYPVPGGGLGYGGCGGGCGGCCGCGGCGPCGGGCCGFPMMCCCCKNGKDKKPAQDKQSSSKRGNNQPIVMRAIQAPLKMNQPLIKRP